jgi:hypothetical protein
LNSKIPALRIRRPNSRLSFGVIPLLLKRGSNPAPAQRDYTSINNNISVCIGRTIVITGTYALTVSAFFICRF